MLRIPSFRKIGDLTVYQDDAVWTRFYLLPPIATIQRDEGEVAQDATVTELQAWVEEEYKRRRTDPLFSSLPEYAGATAPRVELVKDGDPISSDLQRTGDSQLFITRSPAGGGTHALIVRGFADWALTPFVDVAVEWGDNVNQQMLVTLSREATQQHLEIKEASQPKFRYAVTYNLADGRRAAGAKGETIDPVISVPALQRWARRPTS